MKRKLTALALALTLTLAAALPALSQTVEEELGAYWEKADPLYAQIEALGTRQAEIYAQFGLSLEGDGDQTPMDDAQYEQYVKSLNVLTDDELKTLLATTQEIVKLSDEIDQLSAQHDGTEDATEQASLDEQVHEKQHQIDDATASIQDLDARLREAEETHYVMGLKGLTDDARNELLTMYAT